MYFSSEGHVRELRNLTGPKKALNQKLRLLSMNPAVNGTEGVLGAWEHLWPDVMLQTAHIPLPTAMGFFSDSSLAGQGSLIEPFCIIMVLTVQYCLLFCDS